MNAKNTLTARSALYLFSDEEAGLNARIALYGSLDQPALGGIRILPYASDAEADADAERLAHGMARKAAALGLPFCGGKTVVRGDPDIVKSPAFWQALGKAINALKGKYVGGEDVNMSLRDVTELSRQTRFVVGTTNGCGNPAPFTARGVYQAMKAAAQYRYGSATLRDRHVLLQGAGAVGRALAALLDKDGARISVCDIQRERARCLSDAYGAQMVSPDDALSLDCDILCPCALGPVVTAANVDRIEATIIVGAANNQLADNALAVALHARGVTYIPDYLANAGGLIAGAHEYKARRENQTFDREAVNSEIGRISDLVAENLEQSRAMNLPPLDVCEGYVSRKLGEGAGFRSEAAQT